MLFFCSFGDLIRSTVRYVVLKPFPTSFPFSSIDYDKLYPQPWARDPETETRHRNITLLMAQWANNRASSSGEGGAERKARDTQGFAQCV